MSAEIKVKRIKIRGQRWLIKLLSSSEFLKENPEPLDAAVTDTGARVISFQTGHTSLEIVRHELFHAYMAESYINDAVKDAEGFEEAAAEVVGHFLTQMSRQSGQIFKWLNT